MATTCSALGLPVDLTCAVVTNDGLAHISSVGFTQLLMVVIDSKFGLAFSRTGRIKVVTLVDLGDVTKDVVVNFGE